MEKRFMAIFSTWSKFRGESLTQSPSPDLAYPTDHAPFLRVTMTIRADVILKNPTVDISIECSEPVTRLGCVFGLNDKSSGDQG